MSKDSTSFIIELVTELSRTEKRYVRLHLEQRSSGNKNKNLSLFDVFSVNKKVDEKEVKRTFKNYPVHKSYLTNSIFRALRNYHETSNAEYLAHLKFKDCILCHEKNFLKEYDKRIRNLKKFCHEQNLFGTLFEVLKQEMWSNRNRNISNDDLYAETRSIIEYQQNWLEYIQLYDELLYKVLRSDSRVKEDIKKIASNELLNNFSKARTFLAKIAFHNSNMLIYYIDQDYKKAHGHQLSSLTLIMNNLPYLKYNGTIALMTLGNLMTLSYFSNSSTLFEKDYQTLIKTHKLIKGLDSIKFEQYVHFSMLRQKVMDDYSTLNELTNYFNQHFKQFSKTISFIKESDIYFNFAIAEFKTANLQQALDWFIRLTNHPKIKTRQYLLEASLIFELIIHFDLEHISLLENKSRAAVRYFKAKKEPTQFELTLIQFLQRFPNRHDHNAVVGHFQTMKDKLNALPKDELDYFNTIHFDYNKWLDEKINRFK